MTLIERNQWMARQLQIFGVHVHCGIRGAARRPSRSSTRCWSTSRISWRCRRPRRTGSVRTPGSRPTARRCSRRSPPPGCPTSSPAGTSSRPTWTLLISSHAIESIREVWWDIRPHPNFGTVELRICDGLPSLDEIGCVAALSQCLVERFDRQLDDGYTLPEPRPWLVRENKWRAARYGLDAEIVVDNTGRAAAGEGRDRRPGRRPAADRAPARLRRRARAASRGSSNAARATSASAPSRPQHDGDLTRSSTCCSPRCATV